MHITCPTCEAAYAVPEEKLIGRTVKCARCATRWMPVPPPSPLPESEMFERTPPVMALPPEDAVPQEEDEPITTQWPFVDTGLGPPPPRRSKWLLVAWVASFAVIAALIAAAYADRAAIMTAWPPSQRLYGALGLR